MTTQNTPDNIDVELKESVWGFARYCNGLSPWKLNEEKLDPIVEGAINDYVAQLHKLLVAEKLKEIDVLRNGYGWGDALETSEWILDDREKDLKAQLTPEEQLEGKDA